MIARFLIIPILLLCFTTVSAQRFKADTPRATFQYNTENGLPTNEVYSCVQDKYGYLWICTANGLVKYNGYSFKVFTTKDGLPSNDVWKVFPDSYGRVWLGTHGYSIGYVRNDKFTDVINSDNVIYLTDIGEANGAVILNANELFVIDANDNVISVPGFAYCNYHMLFPNIGIDERVYLYTPGSNMYIFSKRQNKLIVKEERCYNTDSLFLMTHYWLFNQNKALSSNEKGFNFYDIKKGEIKRTVYENIGGSKEERSIIADVLKGGNGYFVATTENIYFLDNNGRIKEVKRIHDIAPVKSAFSFVFIDSFQNQWYSSQNDGVWLKAVDTGFLKRDVRLSALQSMNLVGQLPNGNSYWWHNEHHLLIGMDKELNIILRKLFAENILSVNGRNEDTLYVASKDEAFLFNVKKDFKVNYFNVFKNNAFPTYLFDKDRTGQNSRDVLHSVLRKYSVSIQHIYPYSDVIYYAKTKTGIMRNYVKNDTFFVGSDLGYNERVEKMYYDSFLQRYWMISRASVGVLNPENDNFFVATPTMFRTLGISNIEDFAIDKNGNVFVLSHQKLLWYNYKKATWRIIPLNIDATNAKVCIAGGYIYVCGGFGILNAFIGTANDLRFKLMPNRRNTYYSIVKNAITTDGVNLIIETDKGLYIPDIKMLHSKSKPMNGAGMTKHVMSYENFASSLHNGDTVYIPNDLQSVTLDIVNFWGKGNSEYRYSVNNSKWQSSTSGELQLLNMPGKAQKIYYVVKDDVWHSDKYTFYIMQQPFWWQTTMWKRIFWIGGALAVIGLGIVIALITRYYVRKSNEKKQALTDMELRALYAQINPHFIFNTLGTAQFFINRQKMDEAYNHVNKFSRLLRAYLKASGNRYVNLGEEIALLKDYIELQQIRFESKFDYRIDIDNKIAKDSMQIPTLLLQPLVENAINHGLFHLPDDIKGMLKIGFQQGKSSEELVCIIEDNGVGRERSRQLKKDSTIEKDESYGTTLTKKLIDIFKEYEKMDIYLEYIDKAAPENGTIVKLTIGNIKYVA